VTSIAELYALQETDLAIEAARTALADVESRLGESEELVAAREKVAERQEEARAAEKRFKEQEFLTDEITRKIEPIEKKLYGGSVHNPKELEDLQQDIDSLKRRALSIGAARAFDHAMQFLLPVVLVRCLDAATFGEYRLLWLAVGTVMAFATLNMPGSLYFFVPRSEVRFSLTGMSVGPAPSVPAIVVARSCNTVPITSPVLAIFDELNMLGRTTCT